MLAASAAFVLFVGACAPPPVTKAPVELPSPSPTPTTPMAVAPPTFHVGEVGIPYGAVALTASGGVAPYKYTVDSGALPGGLAIGADGSIAGTPTAGGEFGFTVAVSDAGDSTVKVDGKISIADALAAHLRPECASYCNVELGCTTACGNFGTLTGGVGPFAYSLVTGPLPAGTSLNGFALGGTFTGQSGWLQFTVQASDSLGATTTIAPKFWMYDHVTLSGGTCGNANSPARCTVSLPYAGGTQGQSLSMSSTAWAGVRRCGIAVAAPIVCEQPALTATFQGGQATVTLTFGSNSPFTYGTLSVRVSSTDTCAPSNACSADAVITVNG